MFPLNRGVILALLASIMWGLFPIYWKQLKVVDSFEIVAHRVVWSLLFTAALIHLTQGWRWLKEVSSSTAILGRLFLTSLLIGVNWLGFIWGINAGYILECSLGYFICPLVNVLLGFLFLGERLRPAQAAAVALATAGVLVKSYEYGAVPWISLFLAVTFALYALLRKTAKVESLQGLYLETVLMTPIALIYLGILLSNDSLSFGSHVPITINLLLIGSGAVTAIPLLCYAGAARGLTLTTLGVLQYIAPTLQFLLAVFVYGESFVRADLLGFLFIWAALAIYTGEGLIYTKRVRAAL